MDDTRLLFILDQPPYGSFRNKEIVDMLSSVAAFDQPASLLLMGDGVYCALNDQSPQGIDQKNLSKQLGILPIYGVDALFVAGEDWEARSLKETQLLPGFTALESSGIDSLFRSHHQVILL